MCHERRYVFDYTWAYRSISACTSVCEDMCTTFSYVHIYIYICIYVYTYLCPRVQTTIDKYVGLFMNACKHLGTYKPLGPCVHLQITTNTYIHSQALTDNHKYSGIPRNVHEYSRLPENTYDNYNTCDMQDT